MNQFPIAADKKHVCSHNLATTPAELDAIEQPKLLHPYFHDPARHLVFGLDGSIAPSPNDPDQKGMESIRAYALEREDLAVTRKEYQEKAWDAVLKAMMADIPLSQTLDRYRSGGSPYSLACLHYVKLKFEQKKAEFQ